MAVNFSFLFCILYSWLELGFSYQYYCTSTVCLFTEKIKQIMNECTELDRMIRKQLNMYKTLHPRADVDRL